MTCTLASLLLPRPGRVWKLCRGAGFPISYFLLFAAFACGQVEVSPVFQTGVVDDANVDSCAVWVAPDASEALLFVTEKDGDRIEVWQADSGEAHAPKPFLGGPADSSRPGEFDRPNGVWVIYHVPYEGGFADILLVTDQTNERVQVFRLPDLEYFGEFGTGEIGKGYGIGWYQDGTDFFVCITDQEPPDAFPGKIKTYRLRAEGAGLGAELVGAFGSENGEPPLAHVESILVDLALDRIHVCGDEGGDHNVVFRVDGSFTGTSYGDGVFQADQEGIDLYETAERSGYLLVSDQIRSGPNEYEVFDRQSLASLGNFRSRPGGPIVTENTDGCFLEQRPLPGFPNGAFFAVHDDTNVHVYDWTDIAEAMQLEIVGLPRAYAGAPAATALEDGQRARPALWFHDSSWWAVAPGADGQVEIRRLESGTLALQERLEVEGFPEVWSRGDELVVYVSRNDAFSRLLRLHYEPSRRRYVASEDEIGVNALGASSTFGRESDGGRGWLAWIEGGILCVSASMGDDGTLDSWSPELIRLGATGERRPALVALDGAMGILWSGPDGTVFRVHRNEDGAGDWSVPELAGGPGATSVTAVRAGDEVLAAASLENGSIWIARRTPAGQWSEQSLPAAAGRPVEVALSLDPLDQSVHLHSLVELSGHRLLQRREAQLGDLRFGDAERRGHPGVSFHSLLVPASVPPEARELVAVTLGDDGRGYPHRAGLSDRPDTSAPITLEHLPPPESGGVEGGAELSFRIIDRGSGVDRSSLKVFVNDAEAATEVRGVPTNLLVSHELPPALPELLRIRIEARDLSEPAHEMTPFEYELHSDGSAGASFRRGDANEDGAVDIADPLKLLFRLFVGIAPPSCDDSQDVNDDGMVDIGDPTALLVYLFLQGAEPPEPGPRCGPDPSEDALSCVSSSSCP